MLDIIFIILAMRTLIIGVLLPFKKAVLTFSGAFKCFQASDGQVGFQKASNCKVAAFSSN